MTECFPRRRLGASGVFIDELGFGGATVGGLHGPVSEDEAQKTLSAAWEEGIRTYDTAPLYGAGEGERRVGLFLSDKPRSTVTLSTKAGWLVPGAGHSGLRIEYSYAGTVESLERSLERLGVSYFDAVFIHDLDPSNHGAEINQRFREAVTGAFQVLEEWRRQGRIGAIGIGVNDPNICVAAAAHVQFDAFLIAGRYTLLDQGALSTLLPLCARIGASIVVGAPFNTGILAKGAGPGATFAHLPASAEVLARVRALQRCAARYGVSLMAAALQFPLGHRHVASVLPGPRSARQIREVAAAMRTTIPCEFWRDLQRQGLLPSDVPVPGEAEVLL